MAVTTKKTFDAVGSGSQSSTTEFTPIGVELNNQDDLDVYVTLSGGTRVLNYRQSTGSTTDSNHPQVNDTTGLYFPAQNTGVTLYNYTISSDNNKITFNTALPTGAVVSIERRTRDSSSNYTTFAGGSTIRHTDLNRSAKESNFTAQEARNKTFEIEGKIFGEEAKSTGFIKTASIADNAVTTNKLANNAVTDGKVADDTIGLDELSATGTAGSENFLCGDNTWKKVGTAQIDDDAITTAKIVDDAVTHAQMAHSSIGTNQLINGSVHTNKIADDAVTAAQIADDAVGTAQIADDAVTHAQMAHSSVATNQLVNDSVHTNKIADEAVTEAKLDIHAAPSGTDKVLGYTANGMEWVVQSGSGSTNLSNTANGTSLTVESSSGTNTTLPAATTSAWGVMTDEDKTKLDGIAASANNYSISSDLLDEDNMASDSATKVPSQQSVKAYVDANTGTTNLSASANGTSLTVESSTGSNTALPAATTSNWGVMTDEDKTKLDGIETNATADQTGAQIKTAYEAESDTNAYTDAEKTKLSGIAANANNYTHPSVAHIPTGGSSGQVLKYSSSGTAAWGTDNDTTYTVGDGGLTQNNFTNTLKSKLDGIEASADVTDATNVDSAGAVMNSDLDGKGELLVGDGSGDPSALAVGTNGYILKANSSTATGLEWAAAGAGGDVNQNAFSNFAVSGQTTVAADSATDTVTLVGGTNVTITTNATNDEITFTSTDTNTTYSVGDGGLTQNNFTNTLKTKLDGIEASATADQTGAEIKAAYEGESDTNAFTDADHTKLDGIATNANNYSHPTGAGNKHIPSGGSAGQFLKYDSSGTAVWAADNNTTYSVGDGGLTQNNFTNTLKTKLDGIAASANNYSISSDLLDEDNMSSNSATKVPSQQSVKAYVDANAGGSGLSNIVEDTTPQLGGALDMQTYNITGTGTITANSVANSANGMRKITASTSSPSGGSDGDVWIKYTN